MTTYLTVTDVLEVNRGFVGPDRHMGLQQIHDFEVSLAAFAALNGIPLDR